MERNRVEFVVRGTPVPQGSKTVYAGRAVDANAKKLRPWRRAIATAARDAAGDVMLEGPVQVVAHFYVPRPKGHYGAGRNAGRLRPSAPRYPAVKPDLDKLVRALLDGITDGGAWNDDAQVVHIAARKVYAAGDASGVTVVLEEMP